MQFRRRSTTTMWSRVHSAGLALALVLSLLSPRVSVAQIPTVCADSYSLKNLTCCPSTAHGECGEDAGRGACVELNFAGHSNETSDVRVNWPHYYTRVCQCSGNYAGYDCSRCKFGYYGPDCSAKQVLPRKPVRDLTEEEWEDFKNILKLTRSHDSGYQIVLEESLPGNDDLVMTNVSLYGLMTWQHHYAAKDSKIPPQFLDYAHTGPAFYTWHRLFHLVFESEIQEMLKAMGRENYHMFRFPYWDWRLEIQRSYGMTSDELFSFNRLGETRNVSGRPVVFGDLIGEGWDTICLVMFGQICDPTVSTGPLQRCPFTQPNLCSSTNPDWPKMQEVNQAMEFEELETPPYTIRSVNCMRAFADFPYVPDIEECQRDPYCQCTPGGAQCNITDPEISVFPFTCGMHAKIHFLVGQGSVNETLPFEVRGAIDDVAGSPNDPIFILHHLMMDCILQEWLKRHPNTQFPVHPLIRDGHRADDYIRGLFPLYKNIDLLTRAEEFGYHCSLPNVGLSEPIAPSPLETTFSVTITGSSVRACAETKSAQAFKIILRDANGSRQRGIVFGSSGCVMFENLPSGLHRVRAISRDSASQRFKSDWFVFSMN